MHWAHSRKLRVTPLILTLLVVTSQTLANNDRNSGFSLKVGAIQFSGIETSYLADVNGGPLSTTIDFDRDLGVSDSEGSYLLEGIYWLDSKQRLDLSLYNIERSGDKRIEREITFGEETYGINTVVESEFNMQTMIATYSYLFHSHEKVDLGFTAGLHINEIELSLETDVGDARETVKQTAPLPVIGLLLSYRLSEAWTINYQNRVFALSFDSYRGSLNDSKIGFEYRVHKNLGVEFGFNRRSSELEVKEDGILKKLDNLASGFLGNVIWRF